MIFRMVLGHLVGDYLLQTNWMALNKKESFRAAFLHCSIWTLSVCVFLLPEFWRLNFGDKILFMVAIWISHYILDATGIVDAWLHLIGSRSYRNAIAYVQKTMALGSSLDNMTKAMFMVAYTALVQTVADNTLHLVFLYGIVCFFT